MQRLLVHQVHSWLQPVGGDSCDRQRNKLYHRTRQQQLLLRLAVAAGRQSADRFRYQFSRFDLINCAFRLIVLDAGTVHAKLTGYAKARVTVLSED